MATSTDKLKVLLAKSDMDTHDRGIRYVAQVLRNLGVEVVFIRYRVPEEVVQVALQEAVDAIGLSLYSGAALHVVSTVMKLLKEQHMEDVQVVVGGVFAPEYAAKMLEMGVRGVFGPGRPIAEVVDCITSVVR